MTTHTPKCLAMGCTTTRHTGQPFCGGHWAVVPKHAQAAIYAAGRKKNKAAGREAIRAAIRLLADGEGR